MNAVSSVASASSLTSTLHQAGASSLAGDSRLNAMCIVQFTTRDHSKSLLLAVARFDSSASARQKLSQIHQFAPPGAKIKSGVVGKNSFEVQTPNNSGGIGAYVAFVHGPYEVQITSVQGVVGAALVAPDQLVGLAKQVNAVLPNGG